MTPRDLIRAAALAALVALSPATGLAQASVEGKVTLPKAPHAPVMNQRYGIVSYGGVLSPYPPLAVVYLEGAFSAKPLEKPAQMVQRELNFFPNVLPILVGTRVEFPNLDDTYHNIFSYSPAKRFDLGRYRSDERPIPSELFDVAGMVTLRCDIHEHMRAIILVLDTPYYVLTDPEGVFSLKGLPAGKYVLKAWVDSRTTLEKPIELAAGPPLHADFP
jgi:plastocyanin